MENNQRFLIVVAGQRLTNHPELGRLLSSSGYETVHINTIADLDRLLASFTSPAIAFVDPKDKHCSAYEAMRSLKDKSPETQVVVLSQTHSTKEALEAHSRGAFCYFSDPLDVEEFLFLTAKASVVYELAINNRDLKTALSGTSEISLIGNGSQAQKILVQVERVANVNTTVLLTGESGTGKTTLARYIHSKSNRHAQPFISLSCASIPRDLLEAELFGYERGAFTGAVSRKIGSIELANKGTLFLDEIGDLPLELQPKLLTFLQDRHIRRLGGTKLTQVDVRIIAATNRDLSEMVQQKVFREDLYFRMNVVNIKLPSLRERPEDIRVLAENFLSRLAKTRGETKCALSKDAYARMMEHAWPGNIRELENILERASLFCSDHQISVEDLEISLHSPDPESLNHHSTLTLAEIEKNVIEKRLKSFGGNKQQAAESLGISTKTIYNKMRAYGIT